MTHCHTFCLYKCYNFSVGGVSCASGAPPPIYIINLFMLFTTCGKKCKSSEPGVKLCSCTDRMSSATMVWKIIKKIYTWGSCDSVTLQLPHDQAPSTYDDVITTTVLSKAERGGGERGGGGRADGGGVYEELEMFGDTAIPMKDISYSVSHSTL